MKRAQPEASSELERAGALSRALSSNTPAPPFTSHTTRLSAPHTPLRQLPPNEARWPELAEWLRTTTEARAVVVLNDAGLLVAAVGLQEDDATQIGSRLALARDALTPLGDARWLTVFVGDEAMTGLAVHRRDESAVWLAIVGHPAPLSYEHLLDALAATR